MAAVTLELAGTRVLRRSRLWRGLLSMAAAFLVLGRAHAATPAPVEVKVVVVTMFEVGKDEGDEAGEEEPAAPPIVSHWPPSQREFNFPDEGARERRDARAKGGLL